MHKITPFFIALSLIATLAGCGGGSDSKPEGPTGFRGRILEVRAGETIPVPGTAVVAYEYYGDAEQMTWGAEVSRTTTDSEGNYFLPLPPGWYTVGSLYPDDYSYACEGSNPINIEKLDAGELHETVLTHKGCR